jgi:plastocyanin
VRRRVRQRARRKAVTGLALLALVGTAAAVPVALSREGGDQRLIAAVPPPVALTLTPSTAEAVVGTDIEFTATATHPDGRPAIQGLVVDASTATVGQCPAPDPDASSDQMSTRRSFRQAFTEAGVHTVEVSAIPPGCQNGSWTATAMVQVSDPGIELTNDISIVAKVLSQPRAGQSDLVLDVTVTGSREKPAVSGLYIDHDVLFLGDRCKPLGILPSRGPGVFHEVYRYRYTKPGRDRITLFASSLCTPHAGQASLTIDVDVAP